MTQKDMTEEDAITFLQIYGYIVKKRDKTYYNDKLYKAIFDMPLKEMLLKYLPKSTVTRLYNVLNNMTGIPSLYVGQLVSRPGFMYEGYSNMGKKSFEDLKRAVFAHGLVFNMNTKGWEPPVPAADIVYDNGYRFPKEYRERYMASTRFLMGANAAMIVQRLTRWPVINIRDNEPTFVVTPVFPDGTGFMPIKVIALGSEVREYERGLTVHEFRALLTDWKDRPGEIMVGVDMDNLKGIRRITCVFPDMLENGWESYDLGVLTK